MQTLVRAGRAKIHTSQLGNNQHYFPHMKYIENPKSNILKTRENVNIRIPSISKSVHMRKNDFTSSSKLTTMRDYTLNSRVFADKHNFD